MYVTVNIIFLTFWHAFTWHKLYRHTCLAPERIKKSINCPRPKKVVHHCFTLTIYHLVWSQNNH